jgi:flagellar hook-basal body complex protein FliE
MNTIDLKSLSSAESIGLNSSTQIGKDQSSNVKQENKSTKFFDELSKSFNSVNEMQKVSDKMALELASGKSENIHETMLSITQAELSFNFLVQLRNKALEAYQDVMKMPV